MQTGAMKDERKFGDMPPLKAGRVHELSGLSAPAFAFLMARAGEIVLCGPPHWLASLHPSGVGRFHDPGRIIHVPAPVAGDALWAAETALRSGAAPTVVVVTSRTPDLTAFRRLQLAAEAKGAVGLLIVTHPAAGSAAETRWHCLPKAEPLANEPLNLKESTGSGASAQADSTLILASLYKNKRGTVGSWLLNVRGQKDHLRVDATPAGEPVWPGRVASG